MNKNFLFFALLFFLFSAGCKKPNKVADSLDNFPKDTTFNLLPAPDWSKNATIYEVNLRQYTPEGTIKAFIPHVKRLKNLGIDILWIMPPYPIGKEKRKGKLGSPYSISDYTAINSDLGTIEDFKYLVKTIHDDSMKIILDWVGNHTSFDNKWIKSHPEWYTKDSLGNITHPKGTDWTDVADLNYDNKAMRKEMIKSMEFWIKNTDIDGFRCDVAGFVPNDFWAEAISDIERIKHVFMLAEWEDPALHKAGFHATYGWELHHIMNQIAQGKMSPQAIDTFLQKDYNRFPAEAYRMNFITNHDENSWNGTIKERMGDAADAMAVLAFTVQGMPLVYSGQEAGLNKRLSFFDKDQIDWSDLSKSKFYEKLLALHHRNVALWNGSYGARAVKLKTDNPNIYVFTRKKDRAQVIVFLNLSGEKQLFNFIGETLTDDHYINLFTGENKKFNEWIKGVLEMEPWEYLVLEKR